MGDKEFNTSITSYKKLRDYLRYFFIYGCYSRDDFNSIRYFTSRKYDDELRRIKEILGDEYIKESNINREKYIRLDYCYYDIVQNYLVETFLIRNYTHLTLSIFFNIYIILWGNEQLTLDEINEKIEWRVFPEGDLKSTTRRVLEDMSKKGIIQKEKENSRVIYRKKDNIFEKFTDNELKKLYLMICFFSQIQYPFSIGKFLKDSLYRYIKYVRNMDMDNMEQIFLFRYSKLQQFIDEEIVWELQCAIRKRQKVYIKYFMSRNCTRKIKGLPLRITWDSTYGKWYLKILISPSNIIDLRVQDILDIKKLKERVSGEEMSKNLCIMEYREKKNINEVKIIFKVEKFHSRNFLLDKIKRSEWDGRIEVIDDYTFIYTIKTKDWKRMKPWIMSFGHRAKVISGQTHNLYNDIKNEWTEMGEMYGIVRGAEK